MTEIFLKILNMSISACWLILAVLVLRILLKKAPKWTNVLLWGIVAVRLLCPFSIESAMSLVPSAETISPEIMMDPEPTIHTGISTINSAVNPVISEVLAPTPGASVNPLQIWISVLAGIWAVGIVILLGYTAVSFWLLRRKVATAVLLKENIFQSENVGSPFVLGIVRPKIYLPFQMDEQDLGHVIAHEQAHIRRRDHWWKPFGFLLLTIYWFNPLMWLAYVLLCRDIELACDEKVIRELGSEQRADYSQALLACSVNRRMIAACPLSFGEVGVKERVKSVLNYKKPAFWIIVAAVIVCVVVAVCFLTDPAKQRETMTWARELTANDVRSADLVVLPGASDKQFMSLSREEIAVMVSLINQSKGRYVDEHENLNGGSIFFYITLNDGFSHSVGNIGNTYLVIDEDYYEAKYDWLSTWKNEFGEGDRPLPEDYFRGKLTLEDVVELAKKGDELVWNDFERFKYVEVGSGLISLFFEINEEFSLHVGGPGGPTPMYIYLGWNADPDDRIDIRSEDVTEFINKHRQPPAFQDTVIWEDADLDYDGEPEIIRVRETMKDELYELEVVKQDGTVLWSTEAGIPHVGWNTILLYQSGGKDQLVQYQPAMYQGVGSYAYTMFSLEGGSLPEENSFRRTADFELPIRMNSPLRAFAEVANSILKDGTLLLSTEQGELVVGPIAATEIPWIYPVQLYGDGKVPDDEWPMGDEPLEFLFASGAGGWGTTLTLYPDGRFEGEFVDGEADWAPEYPQGTNFICDFSGRFSDITPIGDHSYSMRLEELTYETEVDREWIEDQVRFIGSEAYGIAGGEEFILYLPDTPAEGLNEEFLTWWPDYYLWGQGSLKTLAAYGLYNVNTGEGFFTSW